MKSSTQNGVFNSKLVRYIASAIIFLISWIVLFEYLLISFFDLGSLINTTVAIIVSKGTVLFSSEPQEIFYSLWVDQFPGIAAVGIFISLLVLFPSSAKEKAKLIGLGALILLVSISLLGILLGWLILLFPDYLFSIANNAIEFITFGMVLILWLIGTIKNQDKLLDWLKN